MTKLTPKIKMRKMLKKNKVEMASTVKLFEDIKLKFKKDDEDDSGSESDFEDDDEEIPELVNIPPKKQGAAKTPIKKQTPMKLERKTPQSLAKTPAGKTPIKQQTPMNLERKTPKNLAKTPAKTPIKSNTPKMVKKPVPKDEKEDDSEDIEMEGEDDDLEVPAKLTKPIAKTPIKGSAKKDKKGAKRSAPDVGESSPKKIKMLVDENDELIQAQYARIARTEREKLAKGIDRLKLHIVGLKRRTSIAEVQEAFPKSTNIVMKRSNIYVSFASAADADEAFAEDLTINERKANIVYALADKKGDFDEELIEAQYERSCQIERSRLTFGVNKSELIVKGLPNGTTVAELMEAFDGSKDANINPDTGDGYVKFETEDVARLAFDGSVDKVIKKKEVVVLYSGLSEFGMRDTKTKRRRRKRVTKVVGKGGEKASSNGEKSVGVKNGKKRKRSGGKKVNAADQENGGAKENGGSKESGDGEKSVEVKNLKKRKTKRVKSVVAA